MTLRRVPATPQSRSAQARLAAAVREHDNAVRAGCAVAVVAGLRSRMELARSAWLAERYLAALVALPPRPELSPEQDLRRVEALHGHAD